MKANETSPAGVHHTKGMDFSKPRDLNLLLEITGCWSGEEHKVEGGWDGNVGIRF